MQDQFKAGLEWLAENNPTEFDGALHDLMTFGTTGVEARADGTYRWVPMLEIMRIEKEGLKDAKGTH